MFIGLKKASNVFPKTFRLPSTLKTPFLKPFSSFYQISSVPQVLPAQKDEKLMLDDLCETPPHIHNYMTQLYKYLAAASVIGITSAQLLSFTIPMGAPSAFLILAGVGLEHFGGEYVGRTNPKVFTYKSPDGKIQYGTTNPLKRKLAFASTVLGYGSIIGSLMGIIPVAPSVLPLTAVACLFSTLGHLNYCKFAPKPQFKPMHLFISGFVTGVLGLNLMTSGATIFMWNNPIHSESIEVSTYIGLMLYNMFTGHDSQKAIEDVNNGKGDYLKHANKFSENWLYALIPHFLMHMQ